MWELCGDFPLPLVWEIRTMIYSHPKREGVDYMDVQKQYQEKLTTAALAVSCVESGDWIDYGWCTATADLLDRALAKRYQELEEDDREGIPSFFSRR